VTGRHTRKRKETSTGIEYLHLKTEAEQTKKLGVNGITNRCGKQNSRIETPRKVTEVDLPIWVKKTRH